MVEQEFIYNVLVHFGDQRNPKVKAQGYPFGEFRVDLKRIIGDPTVQNDILKKWRSYWIAKRY